jgi:hypothetical protein
MWSVSDGKVPGRIATGILAGFPSCVLHEECRALDVARVYLPVRALG